jgi:hypothetical protein
MLLTEPQRSLSFLCGNPGNIAVVLCRCAGTSHFQRSSLIQCMGSRRSVKESCALLSHCQSAGILRPLEETTAQALCVRFEVFTAVTMKKSHTA